MENRYEIHYDEIIPGTSCTYRSNGCTIIPLRIIRIHVYTTYDRQPYATLARHGGHMLRRASNTTTSDAIDTYSSKSPLHARERLQRLSVSPSPKRFLLHQFLLGVANSFSSLLLFSTLFPSQLLHHRSFLFIRFSIPHPPYRFFPPCLGNESVPRTGTPGIARR